MSPSRRSLKGTPTSPRPQNGLSFAAPPTPEDENPPTRKGGNSVPAIPTPTADNSEKDITSLQSEITNGKIAWCLISSW